METNRKKEWRIVFWHNDYPDGSRQNNYYGQNGPIFKKVRKKISPQANLEWHFHGGYIKPERTVLLKRLKQADVIFAACPWNMDIDNDHMLLYDAEYSLLEILKKIKTENSNLEIFFLLKPYHLNEEFQKIGQIVNNENEPVIYNYFSDK